MCEITVNLETVSSGRAVGAGRERRDGAPSAQAALESRVPPSGRKNLQKHKSSLLPNLLKSPIACYCS